MHMAAQSQRYHRQDETQTKGDMKSLQYIRQQQPSQEKQDKRVSWLSALSLAALSSLIPFVGVLFAFRFCYKFKITTARGKETRERESEIMSQKFSCRNLTDEANFDHQSESYVHVSIVLLKCIRTFILLISTYIIASLLKYNI